MMSVGWRLAFALLFAASAGQAHASSGSDDLTAGPSSDEVVDETAYETVIDVPATQVNEREPAATPAHRKRRVLRAPIWAEEFTFDVLTGAYGQSYFNSAINPKNSVLQVPSSAEELEMRPNLKLDLLPAKTTLFLRPRVKGSMDQYEVPNPTHTDVEAIDRGEFSFHFNEAYLRVAPVSHLELTAGIMNYQWGPSEVLSASQFMFPELTLKPDPFREFRGVEIAKAEVQLAQEWTFTAMHEFPSSGLEHEDALNYRVRQYRGRSLVRGEYGSPSGEVLLGVVAGEKDYGDVERGVIGSYGFWNYNRGGQLYFDYVGQQGSERLWINSSGVLSTQEPDRAVIYSLGAVGHRYAFENGIEVKIEYIANDFGLDRRNRELAVNEIRGGNPRAANYIAFLTDRTGPLPGTEYGYLAIRIDDPIGLRSLFQNTHLTFRELYAFSDDTQAASLTFESSLGDHFAQSLVLATAFGEDDGELTSTTGNFASYYLQYSY